MRKPIRVACAALALCVALLSGCAGNSKSQNDSAGQKGSADERVSVVCATFPAYDWVRQVAGDEAGNIDITYLMGSGVDLHSYQPTVEGIATIADADLFVYVGGESDGCAADAVTTANNPNLHTVNMLEAVGSAAVEEEIVESTQAEDHDHEHDEAEEHEHEEGEEHEHEEGEAEYDEHVWLSLKNVRVLVDTLATELSTVDPAHANDYAANASAYNEQFAELDKRYAAAVTPAAKDTIVFADRFPFRHLVDDYGLSYYAAFAGCSAETEASFETVAFLVAFLAKKIDELKLGTVLVIEGSDQKIAQTVVATTSAKDQQILVMDSLQSTSTEDIDAGKTYLSTMEDNLATLEAALS